jgi:hypothetical protein
VGEGEGEGEGGWSDGRPSFDGQDSEGRAGIRDF